MRAPTVTVAVGAFIFSRQNQEDDRSEGCDRIQLMSCRKKHQKGGLFVGVKVFRLIGWRFDLETP